LLYYYLQNLYPKKIKIKKTVGTTYSLLHCFLSWSNYNIPKNANVKNKKLENS